MNKILVSACLVGEAVRYDGAAAASAHPVFQRWLAEGRLVPICPEVAGGLPVPRPPAEIDPVTGRVFSVKGVNVTSEFIRGADVACATAATHGCRIAILKDGSPSCGSYRIHDGTFTGGLTAGPGITAARLVDAGVRVFSEKEILEAALWLQVMDESGT